MMYQPVVGQQQQPAQLIGQPQMSRENILKMLLTNRGNEQRAASQMMQTSFLNEPSTSKNENGLHYKIVQMKFKIEPHSQGSKMTIKKRPKLI